MAAAPFHHELLLPGDLAGDAAFWEIYAGAFPPSERDPREVIAATAGAGWVARTRSGGRTVAMASLQFLRAVPVGFLVYLAVAPGLKGQGLGGALLEWLRERAAGAEGLVWEVDRVEAAEGDERLKRARRIRFFEAHGARRLAGPYLQPALDGRTVVPMDLLRLDGPEVSPEGFARAVTRAIYLEKYGALNGVDTGHLEDLLAGRIPPRPAFPGRD